MHQATYLSGKWYIVETVEADYAELSLNNCVRLILKRSNR